MGGQHCTHPIIIRVGELVYWIEVLVSLSWAIICNTRIIMFRNEEVLSEPRVHNRTYLGSL